MSGILDSRSVLPQPETEVIETVPAYDSIDQAPAGDDGDQIIVGDTLYTYVGKFGAYMSSGEAVPANYGALILAGVKNQIEIDVNFTATGDEMPEGYN